ncbi:helicase-related protein [Rhodospirillum centenum]|uniref:RNA helicase RhrA n=2 Tax=Rhodospirillum centenum TaxID=34018 RepID=B6ITX6_RHOCS|nr:helicase-related protein [Rhodospirillum centenum]AAP22927.1 RhrA [Rhodospirillum centenum]ACI99512.1 RNA helicase RhrA [Rhodospirillum centenum SW]
MADGETPQTAPAGDDPDLVYAIARIHPEVVPLHRLGLDRMEQAGMLGMVPLGLPLPKGRRDLVVAEERREAVLLEIAGKIARAQRRAEVLERGRRALEGTDAALAVAEARDRIRIRLADAVHWTGMPGPIQLEVSRAVDVDELSGLDEAELRSRLPADPELRQRLDRAMADVAQRLWALQELAGEPEDSWTFEHLAQRLYRVCRTNHQPNDILRRWTEIEETWRHERAVARGRDYVNTEFDFARFERLFPLARALGRRLVLVIGPTNSGKTHRAMQALRQAPTGVYLAPLRLLALEVMDRLNREGTPTTLLTGEEEIRVPDARHLSSTIEMLDPEATVDVAVIDEVQMLADRDRGWAWTAALMGVPAKTVYLLGAPEVRPLVERAAAHLGEPLEVVELERKQPLHMIEERLEWSDVGRGDALIAFSRREVHAVRDTVQARGLTAAVIYGALAPDVRRREAERFNTGEADVVIATDAIGMGLNLPVRRVLFTTLEKFDGVEMRSLHPAEVKQIAGRAGRFGHFEAGEFGVVGRGTPQALRMIVTRPDTSFGPKTALTVRPTRAMVARLAGRVGSHSLSLLIDCFAAARTAGSPFRVADLEPLRKLAAVLDEKEIGFEDKLSLLFVPADLDKDVDARFFHRICRAVETGEAVPVGLVVPARVGMLDDMSLEELSRTCDLYYWASRKFPRQFPDRTVVQERRAEVSRRLSEILAAAARTRGRTPKPKQGFRGAPRKRYGPRRG